MKFAAQNLLLKKTGKPIYMNTSVYIYTPPTHMWCWQWCTYACKCFIFFKQILNHIDLKQNSPTLLQFVSVLYISSFSSFFVVRTSPSRAFLNWYIYIYILLEAAIIYHTSFIDFYACVLSTSLNFSLQVQGGQIIHLFFMLEISFWSNWKHFLSPFCQHTHTKYKITEVNGEIVNSFIKNSLNK